MTRIALLLAVGTLHSACSAEVPTAGNVDPAATRLANGESERGHNRGTISTMSEKQIVITSGQGSVKAELLDNAASRKLLRMLPLTIQMRDHFRHEKTGNLPSPLPEVQRQRDFSSGMLGLWGNDDFVIYYRNGRAPAPGISVLGRVVGDVAVFDRPGPITIRIVRAD
jgi:hypothetical protein